MAGSRMIRKGFADSDRVSSLDSWFTECFYHRLLLFGDDFGFFDARPAYLRAQLFSTKLDKVREADVSRALLECERAGLIRFYEVDGKRYLEILRYGQRCDKTKPKWPTPPWHDGEKKDVSGKFREVPAIAGAGDGVKEKSGKKESAAVGGDAPEVPAPTPDGFDSWLERLQAVHPSASRSRKLAPDVRRTAEAAFSRCPEADASAALLEAYFKDSRLEGNGFYAPRGQRKFFEDLEDVLSHAERWRKWAGWKPRKVRSTNSEVRGDVADAERSGVVHTPGCEVKRCAGVVSEAAPVDTLAAWHEVLESNE